MTHPRFCYMLAGLVMSVSSLCVPALAQESFSLLSDQQLEKLREFNSKAGEEADEISSPDRSLTIVRQDGPIIDIKSPDGFDLVPPVDFDFIVRPRDGNPVDMDSLEVVYKKIGFSFDVTDRVRENAIITGDRVFARNVDLPGGKHKISVKLEDKNNKYTEVEVVFRVQQR